MEDIQLVGELWKRRVEWLWKMCEETSGRELDLCWLDEQIIKEEAAADARKAPKG